MALARIKTWLAGDVLTAADLNAEFNNVLNNPFPLINSMPSATGDLFVSTGANVWGRLAIGTAGQVLLVSTANTPTWGSGPGQESYVRGLFGTVTSSGVVATANSVLLKSTGGQSLYSTSSTGAIRAVTTSTGLGGLLDAAAITGGTFYHAYYQSTGSAATLYLSLSSNGPPNGPSSFSGGTYLAYAGTAYATTSSGGAVLFNSYMAGAETRYQSFRNVLSGSPNGENAVSLSSSVPVSAVSYTGTARLILAASTTVGKSFRLITGVDHLQFFTAEAVAGRQTVQWSLPNIQTSQFFYNADAANSASIEIVGFRVANGDV